MTKIVRNGKCESVSPKKVGKGHLDTLAQLSTTCCKELSDNQLRFQRKARNKAITEALVFTLIDRKSSLNKSYWQTFHCNKVQLQNGKKVTSRYCNQRWCLVCNRVRTAKLMNGYLKPLAELTDSYFVTLTIPNVQAKGLKIAIEDMNSSLMRIRKNMKKTHGIKLIGIRKLECTYNAKRKDFHPHYHLLIEGKANAEKLVSMWLDQHQLADMGAQDIRKADEGSTIELFKYFSKIVADGTVYPSALDIIFRAMKGKRVFQPIGIKKNISEDIEEIIAQEIDFKADELEIYVWERETLDWVSGHAELLTEYVPNERDQKLLENIKKLSIYQST
jgi:plasmid rolling circle replication initiator protein Rep